MAGITDAGISRKIVSSLPSYFSGYAALTTEYTYPSSCQNRWQMMHFSNDIDSTDSLFSASSVGSSYKDCHPFSSKFAEYSPGVCASGYYMASILEMRTLPETNDYKNKLFLGYCCSSGFGVMLSGAVLCTSKFASTTVTAWILDNYGVITNTTVLSSGSMLAYPMSMYFRSSDLSVLPPSYASALAARLDIPFSATATSAILSSRTAAPSATARVTTPTSYPTDMLSGEGSTPSSSLSTAAKIGLGIGVGVSVIVILIVALVLLRQRKRKRVGKTARSEVAMKAGNLPELVKLHNPGSKT